MEVKLTLVTEEIAGSVWKGWLVEHDGKYADGLGYDEMLGLVAAITMPNDRPTLNWLKTAEQHKAWRDRYEKKEIHPFSDVLPEKAASLV